MRLGQSAPTPAGAKRVILTMTLVVAMTLVSCAPQIRASEPSAPEQFRRRIGDDPGPPVVSLAPLAPPGVWRNPLGRDGADVDSVANVNLPFDPVVPTGLGEAERIVVSRPRRVAARDRAIAWVYRQPQGRFFVLQRLTQRTQRQLLDLAVPPGTLNDCAPSDPGAPLPPTGCRPRGHHVAHLTDGRTGIVVWGRSVTSLTWLQPAEGLRDEIHRRWQLEIEIMGPADELTVAEALHIAASF
jgi:hypothetical protein